MFKPWHFGNTTVRNPLRIRDGLIALAHSELNGNLEGQEQESCLAKELDFAGVLELQRAENYSDMGRKWRSCFSQLGFITHKLNKDVLNNAIKNDDSLNLSGNFYEITPNGYRMINSEFFELQQECMLRALLAYQIKSVIEPRNGENTFNPFIFILKVLYVLYEKGVTKDSNSKIKSGPLPGAQPFGKNPSSISNRLASLGLLTR